MIRKLACALALLGIAFTGPLYALGLGEAKVSSSLNQPLRAEIELVSLKGLSVEEVLPGLATREEFLKANVDRVYFLSDLRFNVEKNAEGKAVVVLTTTKPVREPFLNFLIEVIWPSGRLLREYALLIDPPLFTEDKAKPVAVPVSQAQPRPQPQPQPQPQPVAERAVRGDSVAMPVSAPSRPASSQPGTYGPTDSSDTLWEISLKARPDRSVSPQQVMLAIQDLNPSAFIDGNINKLKAGQVLRLPTKDQIQKRTLTNAINEVIAQNEAINPPKSKAYVSGAKKAPAKSTASASVAGGDELKLVVADTSATGSGSANSSDSSVAGNGRGMESQLAVTLEKLDKSELEKEELGSKVQDLEEQLETLQRLLTLKNDQLANIQAQARQAEMDALKAEEAAGDPGAQVEEQGAMTTTEEVVEDEIVDEEVAEESAAQEAAEDMQSAAADAAKEEQTEAEKAVAPAPVAKAEAPAKQTVQEATGLQKYFELLKSNPIYQAAAAGGLILLLLLLWWISKSNAKKEEQAYQSSDEDYEEDAAAFEEESYEEDELEEAFEEGEEPEDQEVDEGEAEPAAQDEQEDVVAEADVYIAYGRLDQAAAVLEQGISNDPIRADYRLKLLEVYGETGDADAFDRQLSELEAIQDPEAMERALEIKQNMFSGDDAEASDAIEYEKVETTEEDDSIEESAKVEHEALDLPTDADSVADDEPDNSFDFEAVESDLEDDDLGIDLSSDDLELDLDIDIEQESKALEDDLLDLGDGESASETEDSPELSVELDSDEALVDSDELSAEDDLETSESNASEETLLDSELDAELDPELDAEVAAEDLVIEEDALADELDLELGDVELADELEQESEIQLPDDLSIPDELLELDGEEQEGAEEALSADTLSLDDDDMPELPEDVEAPETSAEDLSVPEVDDDVLHEAEESIAADVPDVADTDADLTEDDDFDFLDGTDEASTKLDLARAYIDMGDVDGAKDILLEVEKEGSDEQKAEARSLIDSLGS